MNYQVCNRCVMDNKSDKTIRFDEKGVCNYCTEAFDQINTTTYFPNEQGRQKLEELIEKIKFDNRDKEYDCLMGISGGLDSSYLAYLGYKWGLRMLAVHIDDGFDTDISQKNVRRLCEAANIDLRIIKPDKEQYYSLIKAYMRAGVPDLAVPQDNILLAFLHDVAKDSGVKYFLSGGNFALECILQKGNTYNAMDVVNIKDINKKYGINKIDKLKFISSYKKYLLQKKGVIVNVRPLNYIDYNMKKAYEELKDFCGFEYYGGKHLENIFTAFVQLYWLPKKFNVDKRTSHLSSMIVSGQLSRDDALKELENPIYDESLMNSYIEYIKKELRITDDEFDDIMASPTHQHCDYKTDKMSNVLRKIIK